MTLAQLQSYWYRRTKTNSTSFPAADQVIALNAANEYVLSLIRDLSDNYAPTDWTTTDLSTGTVTPVFDKLYHKVIALHVCRDWAVENDQKKQAGFERELATCAYQMGLFYASRKYRIATVTIATPGVFLRKDHGLVAGDRIILSTSGALPTGLTANTWYYVISAGLDSDNFEVSSTVGGTAIDTSGTQSGTHWFGIDKAQRLIANSDSNR